MKNAAEFTTQLQLPPGSPPLASGVADVKTEYFLITLETSIGRHQRRTLALMQRSAAAKTTTWLWHRPEPLIDVVTASGSQSTDSGDEGSQLQ